jgi:RND family efflux transporter MFP subunit
MNRLLLLIAGAVALAALGVWLALSWLYPAIDVVRAWRGPAVQAVYATGVVEAVHGAKVGPLASGRILAMEAEEGQTVKADDVLARLDNEEARARVAELRARVDWYNTQWQRYSRLRQAGTVSQQSFDEVTSQLNQAKAALKAAEKRLEEMTVRSPLAGLVLRRDGEPGETVREGQTLYWIGKPEPLRVTADVDEDDFPLVSLKQRALIRADAFPDQVFEGVVDEITPKGDPINRTYRVRIALPAATPLLIGMTTEVNIVVRERKDAVLAPLKALKDGKVLIVERGRVRARSVKVGVVGEESVEIVDGVAAGEMLIVDPPPRLADGDAVRTRLVD